MDMLGGHGAFTSGWGIYKNIMASNRDTMGPCGEAVAVFYNAVNPQGEDFVAVLQQNFTMLCLRSRSGLFRPGLLTNLQIALELKVKPQVSGTCAAAFWLR
jgi:hypothetical protein